MINQLQNENRFDIQAINSRSYPHQQVAAVPTDQLHTIAGVYKGKDDPVAIVRSQWHLSRPGGKGIVGPAMLPVQELEYSAFRTSLAELEEAFQVMTE